MRKTNYNHLLKQFCILLFAFCIYCAFGAVSASAAEAADLTVSIDTGASVTLKDADGDGYYDIGTADELYAFAAAVNGGNTAINGELTKNVTVNADVMSSLTVDEATGAATVKDGIALRAHVPIGNVDNRYSGYFTGNGYTLSGIYFKNPEAAYTGLFGAVYYGARVTDLTLTDSYFCADSSTGAIAGQGWGRFENCTSYATVVGNNSVGGIVGSMRQEGFDGEDRMWGCANHGDVYGKENVGGLVGYAINATYIYYSYNTGDVYGTSRVGGLLGYTLGYIESAFSVGNVTVSGERQYVGVGYKEKKHKSIAYLSDTYTEDGGRTAEAFASGEVAYYLNGNSSTALGDGELYWGQCLSGSNADPHPMYDPTPEHVVYMGGQCGEPTYSNDPVNYVIHDFTVEGNDANGICSCGAFEEAVRTTDQYDLDGDGTKDAVYEIANAGQLLWYAELANGLDGADTVILHAVLVNSIDLNPEYDFTFDADSGLVRITRGDDTVAYVGTGIAGAEGGNTVFDSTPSVIGACYASDQSAVTSDVDLSELRVWTPIANGNYWLENSIFDGQGYTVSGLFTLQESDYVGLFGTIEAATVRNVTVCDSLLYGTTRVGAVVGFANTGCVIDNCHNTATVLGRSGQTGGIAGYLDSASVKACSNSGTVIGTDYIGGVVGYNYNSTVENCYNRGTVSGSYYVGGVVGDSSNGTVESCYNAGTASGTEHVGGVVGYNYKSTVENCYNTGAVSGTDHVGGVVGYNNESTVQNCYYLTGSAAGGMDGADAAGQAEVKTAEQFASGEVAHLLGSAWGQNIDNGKENEGYPVLGGTKVYRGYESCGDTEPKYTNDENISEEKPAHSGGNATCTTPDACIICGTEYLNPDNHEYEKNNGICCEIYQPATLVTNENYASLGLNAEYVDYYAISNAGQLFWFANHVNTVDRTASAVLVADIDLKNRPWAPIGSTGEENNNFRGVFDGRDHTIKGLYVEGGRAGLGFFGEVRCGTVKNFTIYGEVVVNTEVDYVGGVIGSICGLNSTDHGLERNGAIIQNITSYVNLTAKAHGVGKIGGFVGYANHRSLIENCSWYGTFDAGIYRVDSGAGGFIGKIQENTSEVTIRNCAAYGTIKTGYAGDYNNTATIYMGGFLSFSNTGAGTVLENCLFAGKFERGENLTDEAFLGAFGTLRGVNSIKNCYYLGDGVLEAVHSDSPLNPESDNVEITSITVAQLLSGEIAYKLGEAFGQTLTGEMRQSYPVLGGKSVPSSRFEIYGQQLNIGGDLSMKYYVMGYAPDFNSEGLAMEFRLGGVKTVVSSGSLNANGFYVFTLEGISPQCMGDNIYARLSYGEIEVADHGYDKKYSVEINLCNLLDKYQDDAALVTLIKDTLAYGKAAEAYGDYASIEGDHMGSGRDIPASEVEATDAIAEYAVRFGALNSIIIEVDPSSFGSEIYVVECNGAELRNFPSPNSPLYRITNIAATDFDKEWEFVVRSTNPMGDVYGKLTFSVNDYLHAISQSTDASDTVRALAKALYNYGVSAKEYAALQSN